MNSPDDEVRQVTVSDTVTVTDRDVRCTIHASGTATLYYAQIGKSTQFTTYFPDSDNRYILENEGSNFIPQSLRFIGNLFLHGYSTEDNFLDKKSRKKCKNDFNVSVSWKSDKL